MLDEYLYQRGAGERTSLLGIVRFLNSLNCPVITINQMGFVQDITEAAKSIFGICLFIRSGHLVASDACSNALLQALIRGRLAESSIKSSEPQFQSLLIRTQNGRPIVVQARAASDLPLQGAAAILVLTDLDACPELPESRLKSLFGLTHAEAAVAVQIATGEALEDIATGLRISISTARSHVRSIFSKQTRAVRLNLWPCSGARLTSLSVRRRNLVSLMKVKLEQ